MLKLRYDATTGKVGSAYDVDIEVPEPFLEITEEQHDKITTDENNIYFVEKGKLTPKNKLEIEQKEWFLQNYFQTFLGFIKFKPTLKNGDTVDFISLLPQYKSVAQALGSLQANAFIYYDEPDYTQELTPAYLENIQHLSPQMSFTQYCALEMEVTTAYQKAFFG